MTGSPRGLALAHFITTNAKEKPWVYQFFILFFFLGTWEGSFGIKPNLVSEYALEGKSDIIRGGYKCGYGYYLICFVIVGGGCEGLDNEK